MTIDKLTIGDRFRTILTQRTGTVLETGINIRVKWDNREVDSFSVDEETGEKVKCKRTIAGKEEIISSKTEVEKC